MNRTNCPNCGAPLKWGNPHCEFCGTRIVDLTMLDFDTNEPTAFVLKMPRNLIGLENYKDYDVYLSMMAKPELGLVTTTVDTTTACGGWGNGKLTQFDTNRETQIEVTLHSFNKPNDKLVFMEKHK